jgi:hypothetical protein
MLEKEATPAKALALDMRQTIPGCGQVASLLMNWK